MALSTSACDLNNAQQEEGCNQNIVICIIKLFPRGYIFYDDGLV